MLESDSLGLEFVEFSSEEGSEALDLVPQVVVFLTEFLVVHNVDAETVKFSFGDVGIVDGLDDTGQSHNLVFEVFFPLGGSPELFLKVLDFLLKFDELVFLLIHQQVIVEYSSGGIGSGGVDATLHKPVEFTFEEEQSFVEVLFLVALHDEAIAFLEPTALEGKEDVFEVLEFVDVGIATDDHGLSGDVLVGKS